ncbi:DNA cytosine methyltransferase [Burkholderia sp. Ac-20365]|nr:DNA cytosine methyltransferase [Burkholderia sp. Ac-20365]MBN3761299.1 DNA cytosine methyltransferase [Burkholderia sp. Ac-20365]
MQRDQFILDIEPSIVCDLFAGGGGMSEGIEMALNRHAELAINHNPHALSMHQANHPQTEHLIADVREVCPYTATRGRRVGLLHASPDCTHFSQAKAGQPRDHRIRALSWVVLHWAGTVRPEGISLENVAQIQTWTRLVAKRDPATGRVIKIDGSIAGPREHVPVQQQYLVPDRKRLGRTWKRFVALLRGMGYKVEWRVTRACDYGARTTRERLLMIARCDGADIVWPEASHSTSPTKGQQALRTAAECIDFTIPSRSIFGRKKELAAATLRRIAVGIDRFVLKSEDPFIVPGLEQGNVRLYSGLREPFRAVSGSGIGGPSAAAAPVLIQMGYGERDGQAPRALDIRQPLGTVVAGGAKHAIATAYLAQMNGGFNDVRGVPGHDLRRPMSSITNKGSQQQLITAHLAHLRGNCDARDLREPLHTISAGGQHHALVECHLSPDHEEGALRVASFLRQHGVATNTPEGEPVTVTVGGNVYVIVDVQLRMLEPRALYNAQGFPENYIIDKGHDGRIFTKTQQIHMCGNSVSPPWAAAFISANFAHMALPGSHPKAKRRTVQDRLMSRAAA